MKSTSLALLAVIMSTVVLAGCMGAKPTEEVMPVVESGATEVVNTVEEMVMTGTNPDLDTPSVTSGTEEAMTGAAEVVNQVVNEVTTAQ
jgi:hypothetical protein